MYNEHLRSCCYAPEQYDRMIALITKINEACPNKEWAARVINVCISGVVFDGHEGVATGMCVARLYDDGSDSLERKVRLAFEPIGAHVPFYELDE